jgi:hypothetical protein
MRKIKRVNMDDVLSIYCGYGTLKLIEATLRKGRR